MKKMYSKIKIFSVYLPFMLILTACQSLPSLFSSVEQIADDTAISTKVSREAIAKDTDVEITIKVINKDTTP
jgi:hypothetical protein